MSNKTKLWVVDDSDFQRELIIASLIKSSVKLSNATKAKNASDVFEITRIASAREAQDKLLTCQPDDLPDLIISDNNFEDAIEYDLSDNASDRGLTFLEVVREKYPEIPVILVTSNNVTPFLARLKKLTKGAFLDFDNCVFGIDKGKIQEEGKLNEVLKAITKQKFNFIAHESRPTIEEYLKGVTNTKEMLCQEVKLDGKFYLLSSLLGPWAKIDYKEKTGFLMHDDNEIKTLLYELVPSFDLLPPGLKGQLAVRIKLKSGDDNVLHFYEKVKKIILDTHADFINELRPEVIRSIESYFAANEHWTTKHFSASSFSAKPLDRREKNTTHLKYTPQPLEFRPNTGEQVIIQTWKEILRSRLTIIGLEKLRQERKILSDQFPFAIDFAIHCIIREKPEDFIRMLEELGEIDIKDTKSPKSRDVRSNTKRYFTTLLGLSGSLTQRHWKSTFPKHERINPDCLFDLEKQFLSKEIAALKF